LISQNIPAQPVEVDEMMRDPNPIEPLCLQASARRAWLGQVSGHALKLALPATLGAWSTARGAEEDRPPMRGQPGKDVMWLPTPDELMFRLFDAAQIGRDDLVYDLGAGDGRVAIAAARRHGARAVGIEYDAKLAHHAQRNVERAGLADRVRIIQGDIFQEDFSSATVLTLYLLEELNQQLRPKVLSMRPGTRVVSNTFSMGDWEPDAVIQVRQHTGYFWRVPAPVAGRWRLEWPQMGPPATITLSQRYQRLAGSIEMAGRTRPLFGPEIDGVELSFRFVDESGLLRVVRLKVDGERVEGVVAPPFGMVDGTPSPYPTQGRRLASL
jgi:SAM-dependent methyltransferase